MPYVQGLGAGPDFAYIVARTPNGSIAPSIYDQAGTAVMGLRSPQAGSCGSAQLAVAEDGQTVGLRYRDGLYSNQRWMLRPANRASELLSATQADFTYPDAFVGNDSAQGSWFTPGWIAEEFTGFMSVANVKTGAVAKVDAMPGSVSGEYDQAVVVGDAVFVEHYTNKSD